MLFKNKVVLVTGGAGFIGSHIVDRCLTEGAEQVISLDNLVAGKLANLAHIKNKRLKIVKGDVRDFKLVKRLVKGSDVVFHEAASKMVVSLKEPRTDLETNIVGTFNILEAARDSNVRIIHASTGSVLGSSDRPMGEDHSYNPTTLYGISKMAGESYVKFYAREFGIKATTLRYFHVYGPRQDYSGEAGVVSIFLSRVLRNKSPVIFSGGEQIRCFTYVTDDVEANMLLYKNSRTVGEVYNVAARNRVSVNQLADMITKKYATKPIKPVYGPHRQGENPRPEPDTAKIEALGFRARVPFEEGLELTKRWVEKDMDLA